MTELSHAQTARELSTPPPLSPCRHLLYNSSCLGRSTGYVAHRCPASGGIRIDGLLDEPCWADAAQTAEFVDIVGPSIVPWHRTTAKMVWDDSNLYIAAELEDPRGFAYESKHDRCVWVQLGEGWDACEPGWAHQQQDPHCRILPILATLCPPGRLPSRLILPPSTPQHNLSR